MKILYLTDLNYFGTISSDYQMGLRPPMSWISALKPFHCPYSRIDEIPYNDFDITILSCLHENVDVLNINLEKIKNITKKILFQHDSDHRYFYKKNSLSRSYMLNYIISNVDAVLVHNDLDKQYYQSLFQKPCFIHEQLIFDTYSYLDIPQQKSGVILGGIDDRYGALDGLFLIYNIINEKIYCFGDFEPIPEVIKIENTWDYIEYNKILSKFKIALNLTPMAIGGSFPLQCAMVGVPCVGWDNSHTLKKCFPDLVAPYGDFESLRIILNKLNTEDDFYNKVASQARHIFLKEYNIEEYKKNMNLIFNSLN